MGAIFPVLDKEIEGLDISSVSGKMINRYEPELGEIAENAGFTPLMHYFGADPAEYLDEDELDGLKIPDEARGEKWFEPEDGRQTINFFLDYLRENPARFGNDTQDLISDLGDFERVLAKAGESAAKWHVMIEI